MAKQKRNMTKAKIDPRGTRNTSVVHVDICLRKSKMDQLRLTMFLRVVAKYDLPFVGPLLTRESGNR
jgi:hypothetical protein